MAIFISSQSNVRKTAFIKFIFFIPHVQWQIVKLADNIEKNLLCCVLIFMLMFMIQYS